MKTAVMELYRNMFLLAIPLNASLLTGLIEALILRDSKTDIRTDIMFLYPTARTIRATLH